MKIIHTTTYEVERVTVKEARVRDPYTVIFADDMETCFNQSDFSYFGFWDGRTMGELVYIVLSESTRCELVEDAA